MFRLAPPKWLTFRPIPASLILPGWFPSFFPRPIRYCATNKPTTPPAIHERQASSAFFIGCRLRISRGAAARGFLTVFPCSQRTFSERQRAFLLTALALIAGAAATRADGIDNGGTPGCPPGGGGLNCPIYVAPLVSGLPPIELPPGVSAPPNTSNVPTPTLPPVLNDSGDSLPPAFNRAEATATDAMTGFGGASGSGAGRDHGRDRRLVHAQSQLATGRRFLLLHGSRNGRDGRGHVRPSLGHTQPGAGRF